MTSLNRRTLLGSGAVGAAGVFGAGCSDQVAPPPAPAVGGGEAPGAEVAGVGSIGKGDLLDTHQPHLFDVARSPAKPYDGGELFNANQETFPILRGQDVSGVLVRLQPRGVREPHWHPSAWEFHYVISGTARFSLLETEGYHETFTATAGQAVFLPQGSFHYFENASPSEDYVAWLVFNTSALEPQDDIGLVGALGVIPNDVLGAVLHVDPAAFADVPKKTEPVTITRKP
jgi:oxalate decarboxylase